MTDAELLFFNDMPQMFPVYAKLREELDRAGLDCTAKVGKTQITLRNRYVFAGVSLPWRKVKGWPEVYLLVSFGLSYRKEDPRIALATEPYPNRWTHHVVVSREEEVDGQLLGWLREARDFARCK